MKLNINNKTDLSLTEIALIYDDYCNGSKGSTFYEGKVDKVLFLQEYIMEITYHKTLISIVVNKLNIEVKNHKEKGLMFPRLPKRQKKNE